MLSRRNQLLLIVAAYLLLTPVSAQGWWGNNGNDGGWNYGNGGCPPWVSSDDCSNNSNNNGGSSNGASTDPSQYGLTEEDLSRSNRIATIHAVLACLVWVLFIPSGGILLRLRVNSPWIVRIHAALQSLSFLVYVIAAAMGVWLVRTLSNGPYSLWSDPHPKLGMAILFLAFLQPIFGLVHHRLYKKRAQDSKTGRSAKLPGRTTIGYLHLWLGRLLIILGITNGALGLRLASQNPYESHSRTKIIAYAIGAGIMFLLYLIFVIMGEVRRSKANRETSHNRVEGIMNVPLQDTTRAQVHVSMPPTYVPGRLPPSYEASQAGARKQAETTVRYS